MPILDDSEILSMRRKLYHCPKCIQVVLKNYCRECDEFFYYGHDKNCEINPHQHEAHKEHRTY